MGKQRKMEGRWGWRMGWDVHQPTQSLERSLAPHTQCPPGIETQMPGNKISQGWSIVAEGTCKISRAQHLSQKSCKPRTFLQGKAEEFEQMCVYM